MNPKALRFNLGPVDTIEANGQYAAIGGFVVSFFASVFQRQAAAAGERYGRENTVYLESVRDYGRTIPVCGSMKENERFIFKRAREQIESGFFFGRLKGIFDRHGKLLEFRAVFDCPTWSIILSSPDR